MIEEIIYDYLKRSFSEEEIPVYMERPATKPSCYVIIEKTGGGEENHGRDDDAGRRTSAL